MAESACQDEDIDCPVCQEALVDPRPLPCGHSYCGPARNCLRTLENDERSVKCAICRSEFNLAVDELKPLYGIRDHLAKTKQQFCQREPTGPLCNEHNTSEIKFWCLKCEIKTCELCIQDNHDGHSVRNLKRHLVEKLEAKFGENVIESLRLSLAKLEERNELNNRDLISVESRGQTLRDSIADVETQAGVIEKC